MQRWISIGTLLLGCAAFGVVMYVQETPRAFTTTHPVMVLPVLAAPTIGPDTVPEPATPRVVELPTVHVTGTAPAMRPKRSLEPSVQDTALEPCSPWHEIGPEYVTDGVATGSRRVRELC
jgi:hypothetical protein